jgi:hypothetical protein
MKVLSVLIKTLSLLCLLLPAKIGAAQNKASVDMAAVRNMHSKLTGLNLSCFYHFTEKLSAGVEMNRFFTKTAMKGEEKVQLSAWDFDLNVHYLLPLYKHLKYYPLTGISHTAEKEVINEESVKLNFWSFNTGAGLICECGKLVPHIEYNFTWGKLNQQFLLAGISYELEWGHHSSKK